MLRKIRIVAATICFTLITLLFLDFTGTLHLWFGWLAKIQFLPAVLALNVGVVAFLVILTLLFGRVYCSVICPLGVFQDIVSWISGNLMTFMQPEMSYERGYCRPECTKCSEVCPTGAIRPITVAEKSSIQIGHAVWVKRNCIPFTDGVDCGNCARHCPVGAIQMVPFHGRHRHRGGRENSEQDKTIMIPVINTERCIGCGTCENLCPARPFSAIYVEGHEHHRII